MFFSKTWDEVPGGSILRVAFTASGPFVFAGDHTVDRGAGAPVLVGQIREDQFPLAIPLHDHENHMMDVDIGFAGKNCTLELNAQVTEPDGSVHQQAFSANHVLKSAGDMLTVKLSTVAVAS